MRATDTCFPFANVEYGGRTIRLRALCLPSIARIIDEHAETIAAAVAQIQAAMSTGDPLTLQAAQLRGLASLAPVLTHAIAFAANALEEREWFAHLPAAVQLQCAKEVWRLTAADDAIAAQVTSLFAATPVFELVGSLH